MSTLSTPSSVTSDNSTNVVLVSALGRNKPPAQVQLADGSCRDLSSLGTDDLHLLQWEQERAFAQRIVNAPKGSPERAEAIRQAYDTVCVILAAQCQNENRPLVMGINRRTVEFVLGLLTRHAAPDHRSRLFEIGYGSGTLLQAASDRGFEVAGIEVSREMHRRACQQLDPVHHDRLLVGDFLGIDLGVPKPGYDVVYWNDVFEHIPPDEIPDYLCKVHSILAPGGVLVTYTPNWHMRPMDVTGDFCPARTEAAGLHLREYTLCEVTRLLQSAGFCDVATPLFVSRRRMVQYGEGLGGLKRWCEPCLERLPHQVAAILCRGLGLSWTLARKGSSRH